MAFAVAALSAACAKEESPAPESGGRLVERTFTAGTAALTKTSLDWCLHGRDCGTAAFRREIAR